MAKRVFEDKKKPEIEIELERLVEEMRQKSPVTEGECAVCGTKGKLLSGVCEACFLPWATEAAKSQMRWRRK